MRREARVQIIASVVLVGSLVGSAITSAQVAASLGRNKLTFTDKAVDGDPPQVALGIAMGAFRGFFVNYLWIRANKLKEAGRYHEAVNLSRAITTLQPRFPRVWAFHAWNMTYNISVTAQTPEERWEWVNKGIRLLRNEGIQHNPNELLLYKELAWFYQHKVQGYTDDSNPYYKRAMAAEWTYVLGPPPPPNKAMRDRKVAIEIYATWLETIADAPRTIDDAIEVTPAIADLLVELRNRVGETPGYNLLQRYELQRSAQRSIRAAAFDASMGSRSRAMRELMLDSRYADAWDVLIRTTRRRVLLDEYKMDPRRMVRYTRKFGPLDWRSPATHAVYWSHVGAEECTRVVTSTNFEDMDIINIDRSTMQSLQELFRYGEIYFDPLDFFIRREQSIYFAVPNVHFVQSYNDMLEEAMGRGGFFEDRAERGYTTNSAGYENFLKDAIRFYYRRGERRKAQTYYKKLRNFPGRTTNVFVDPYIAPIDEFIDSQFKEDRFKSPHVAVTEVAAALQGAFVSGLLLGDTELFDDQMTYARRFHAGYMRVQRNPVTASRAVGRMEIMPADFMLMAGIALQQFIGVLNLDDAEQVYLYAPESLKRYAYIAIKPMYEEALNAAVEAGVPDARPFDAVFMEPEGMDMFLRDFKRKLDAVRRRAPPVDSN